MQDIKKSTAKLFHAAMPILPCFIFFFLVYEGICQQENTDSAANINTTRKVISTEFFIQYPYYWLDWQFDQKFNYEFGGTAFIYFNKIKVGSGLSYSTKNYEMFENDYYFKSSQYYVSSLCLPFEINIMVVNSNKFKFGNDLQLGFGYILSFPLKYEVDMSFNNPLPTSIENPYIAEPLYTGKSIKLSARYQRIVNKYLDLFIGMSYMYKIKQEYTKSTSHPSVWTPYFSQDKHAIKFALGFEIFYNRKRFKNNSL